MPNTINISTPLALRSAVRPLGHLSISAVKKITGITSSPVTYHLSHVRPVTCHMSHLSHRPPPPCPSPSPRLQVSPGARVSPGLSIVQPRSLQPAAMRPPISRLGKDGTCEQSAWYRHSVTRHCTRWEEGQTLIYSFPTTKHLPPPHFTSPPLN